MTGTLLNSGAIILGGLCGLIIGSRLPEKLKQAVVLVLGIFTLLLGIQFFLKTENALIPLLSLLLGVVFGEWLDVEARLNGLSTRLEKVFIRSTEDKVVAGSRFIRGFISTSIIYCSGPMAILGAIQNGITGEYSTLTIKSILDGFASLAFAASLGWGVIFSSIPVLLYQGSISLFAGQIQQLMSTSMINEFTAVGGVILFTMAISSFLEIKPIRSANLLPALFLAPLFTLLASIIK